MRGRYREGFGERLDVAEQVAPPLRLFPRIELGPLRSVGQQRPQGDHVVVPAADSERTASDSASQPASAPVRQSAGWPD
eukprot:1179676-Prorocentrum_minimum.AAC.2